MKTKMNQIEQVIFEHEHLISLLKQNKEFISKIDRAVSMLATAIKNKKKILVCGNGGSAADSQHLAGELVGRFQKEREPIECISLTTNTSIITAIGNDYGFDRIFARQIDATGKNGDVVILISTSGKSTNIIEAAKSARMKKMKIISLTGYEPNMLSEMSDLTISVPSKSTPRIQEIHSIIIHLICGILEETLFSHEK